jgi:hypothetical protein
LREHLLAADEAIELEQRYDDKNLKEEKEDQPGGPLDDEKEEPQ